MKNKIKWGFLGLLLIAIFSMTLMKTPQEIAIWLTMITSQVKIYSVIMHILFLTVIIFGLCFKKIRNVLFFLFIAFLSLFATVISVKYMIVPNIMIFALFFLLIVNAYFRRKLNFDLENSSTVSLVFAIIGFVFGFWYLHWVQSPVLLNALIYSPLGSINCPTMVTICGFLCLTKKPRSVVLEAIVSLVTLYFGFFGLFRLGAYIDIALIICALFLIFRLGSYCLKE
ncbi:hypothetical protein KAX97_07870 [candidate division WOR-3 bacterium]|nr:hypothetical protein [candidate division WOR-3 bacterium]